MAVVEQNYVGCDISKDKFDVFDRASGRGGCVGNDAASIAAFVARLRPGRDFVVMEATGVADRLLRHALAGAGVAFARLNPAHVYHHGKSGKRRARTDRMDARLLCDYGFKHSPAADPAPNRKRERLQALVRRRDQLVETRARHLKQRAQAFETDIAASIQATIDFLESQLAAIARLIDAACAELDPTTQRDYAILTSAPGVSKVTATVLIACLPELGKRSPKSIAALAGVAPFDEQSGKTTFKSTIQGGRPRVRKALYMAALSAARRCPKLAPFYEKLAARAGSKKLALLAVARKLLVSVNAMIRDQKLYA